MSSTIEQHYMIDLETLGVSPGSVISSIAAVQFDINTGEIGRQFYKNIDLQQSLDNGFTINAETLKWWFNQPNRMEIFSNPDNIKSVFTSLSKFILSTSGGYNKKNIFVWGNGASFDLGILNYAYNKLGIEIPWLFYNERDVRTLVSFIPEIKKKTVNSGVLHNPLDDCKYQIAYCCEIYKQIKQKL